MKFEMAALVTFVVLFCAGQDARAVYQQQQAVQEVHRLANQFDQLVNNQDAMVSRLVKLEAAAAAPADTDVRAEIAALKASVAELRRDQETMRREIVADLAKRIAALPANNPPPPVYTPAPSAPERRAPPARTAPARAEYTGPHYEHVVEAGQTLSFIAKGYETTVAKIKSANNLKSDVLRVGQKLIVPAEEKGKAQK